MFDRVHLEEDRQGGDLFETGDALEDGQLLRVALLGLDLTPRITVT